MNIEAALTSIGFTGKDIRTDCPFCGGKNSFTASVVEKEIIWNCYRASCNARGRTATEATADSIRERLRNEDSKSFVWALPPRLVPVTSSMEAVAYLKRNNCMPAYARRSADILYDPALNRVIFVCKDDTGVTGATGRSLDNAIPKWLRYDNNRAAIFVCGLPSNDCAVLVEDCASACAVSKTITGLAVLGTALPKECLSTLRKYRRVVIGLDRDATQKAIKWHRLVSYFVRCSVIRLDDDLKYYNETQIEKMFQQHFAGE